MAQLNEVVTVKGNLKTGKADDFLEMLDDLELKSKEQGFQNEDFYAQHGYIEELLEDVPKAKYPTRRYFAMTDLKNYAPVLMKHVRPGDFAVDDERSIHFCSDVVENKIKVPQTGLAAYTSASTTVPPAEFYTYTTERNPLWSIVYTVSHRQNLMIDKVLNASLKFRMPEKDYPGRFGLGDRIKSGQGLLNEIQNKQTEYKKYDKLTQKDIKEFMDSLIKIGGMP